MADLALSQTAPMQQRPLPCLRSAEDKARAYQAGRAALKAACIGRLAHELYEIYVRRVGDNPYCWPGSAELQTELRCKSATLTRANNELVAAGLIRRQRQMGRTWHTSIVAYDGRADDASPPMFLPDAQPVAFITNDECDPPLTDECDPVKNDDSDSSKMTDHNIKTKHIKENHPKTNHPNHHHPVVGVVESGASAGRQAVSQSQATPPPRSAGPSPNVLRLPTPAERPLFERLRAARHPHTGETVAHPLKVLDALAATERLDLAFLERLLAYCGDHGRGFGLLLSLAGNPQFDPPATAPPLAQLSPETARPADNPADNDRYRQQAVDYGQLLALYGESDV